MKAMANIISFFTPDASKIVAPGGTALNSMTKLVPGTQIGEEGIIETEAGVFKIIYEGPSEGIEGKRQLDHALPGSRRN
ncbi:MAG: hypothetical protein U9R15_18080, partial [Chloroflexota bacterium]|nr:hypothetical protein [Chloroflexota bacterium]